MNGHQDRDAAALAAQRERERQAAIQDVANLCAYVVEMHDTGQLERGRAGGIPLVPGGQLWMLTRLYFDHPAIFDAARSGQYVSVSAAARAAGIASAMLRRRITLGRDPAKWARQLFDAVSREELHAAAVVLNQLEEARDDEESRSSRAKRVREVAQARFNRLVARADRTRHGQRPRRR